MEFANKEYFLLLLLLIPYVLWFFLYRKRSEPTMRMSDTPGEKIDGARGSRPGSAPRQQNTAPRKESVAAAPSNNAMASLFANAKQLKKR